MKGFLKKGVFIALEYSMQIQFLKLCLSDEKILYKEDSNP
jgi:hypothetical protein